MVCVGLSWISSSPCSALSMNQSRKWSSVAWPRCSVDLRAVPVGLPRERLPIEQGLDDDHLPVEAAGLHRPGGGRREQRSEQERPLGIDRVAVGVAELVPDVEVRRRAPGGGGRSARRGSRGCRPRRRRRAEAAPRRRDLPGRRPRCRPPPRAGAAVRRPPSRSVTISSAPWVSISGAAGETDRNGDRRGHVRPRHAESTPPRPWPGCGPTVETELRRLPIGDRGDYLAAMLHDVPLERGRRRVAEVAGLGPEVLEVGGVGHDQRPGRGPGRRASPSCGGRTTSAAGTPCGVTSASASRSLRRPGPRTCRRCRPARRRRRSGRGGVAGSAARACGR